MDIVANWLWKGCLVAVVTAVVLRLLGRAPAHVRYVVCWTGLCAVVALPLLSSLPLLHPSVPALVLTAPIPASAGPGSAARTSDLLLLTVWALWLVVQAQRFATAMFATLKIRRGCRSFPITVERRLRHWTEVRERSRSAPLVVSADVGAAAVIGCGVPVIAVAPALVQQLTADELDRVVIHEWAHVQRRDDLANVAQLVVRALAGWHPAVWWLDRRLRAEREHACDEMTIALTRSPKLYAACLVKLASLSFADRHSLPALGVLSRGALAPRIERIVSRKAHQVRQPSHAVSFASVVFLAGVSVAVGSVRFVDDVIGSSKLGADDGVVQPIPSTAAGGRPRPTVPASSVNDQANMPRTGPSPGPVASRRDGRGETRKREAASAGAGSAQTVPNVASTPSVTVDDTPAARRADAHAPGPLDIEPEVHSASPETPLPARAIQVPDPAQVAPWRAVANAGITLGERSKAGGVATGRFFSRFGKRLADSF